jgi:hypothetical protein
MSGKIFDLIGMNKDLDGRVLPIEKEMFIKNLGEIPHDIAEEYSNGMGAVIEEQLLLKNSISTVNGS